MNPGESSPPPPAPKSAFGTEKHPEVVTPSGRALARSKRRTQKRHELMDATWGDFATKLAIKFAGLGVLIVVVLLLNR